ncbi:hypothetical protein ACFQPF_02965 [Fictibacillus iocasae]|uniref:Uncharacterized protein n=1 Tax=Fictibacillus iocasae TaxID=2715437 RepID=A0ABW2NLF4_9BACL
MLNGVRFIVKWFAAEIRSITYVIGQDGRSLSNFNYINAYR